MNKSHEQKLKFSKSERLFFGAMAPALAAAAIAGCATQEGEVAPDTKKVEVEVKINPAEISYGPVEVPFGSDMTRDKRFDLSPKDYYKVEQSMRTADFAEYIQKYAQATYDHIVSDKFKKSLSPAELKAIENGLFSMPDFKKPRSEWSDQDYANYLTIATAYVTGITSAETGKYDKNMSLRALSAIHDPESPIFKDTVDVIEQDIENDIHGGMQVYIYRAERSPILDHKRELKEGTYGQAEVADKGGRLVRVTSLSDESINGFFVFSNYADDNGNIASFSRGIYSESSPTVYSVVNQHD